jgi:hypothetical protein
MPTLTSRLTNTGTLLVNGTFDEYTSISPAKFRTTINTVYSSAFDEVSLATGAISFNGTSQYLTVPASTNWALGTGDFTIEWYQYMTTQNSNPRVFSVGTYPTASIAVSIEGGTLYVWEASGYRFSFSLTAGGYLNQWVHFAISRVGGTTKVFKNGTQIGSSYADTNNISDSTTVLTIGNESTVSVGSYFTGYISNFRIIKGTGVYTANFVAPQSILPAVTNTKLLLNVTDSTNFIRDNSINNVTVTNNGTATWTAVGPFNRGTTVAQRQINDGTLEVYTAIDEFTGAPVIDSSVMVWLDSAQSASFANVGSTWYDLSVNSKNYTLSNSPTYTYNNSGPVLTFAGASSQFTTSGTTLFNSTTFNAYTINLWVYPTGAGQLVAVTGQATINTSYHYSAIEISAAGVIKFGQWSGSLTTVATSTQSLNAWYNLVITYNGTTATAYVNNTNVGSSTIAWSSPGASTFFPLMAIDGTNMGTTGYASGSVGAFMVYNRGLSADEVSNNFNALRQRYGK